MAIMFVGKGEIRSNPMLGWYMTVFILEMNVWITITSPECVRLERRRQTSSSSPQSPQSPQKSTKSLVWRRRRLV